MTSTMVAHLFAAMLDRARDAIDGPLGEEPGEMNANILELLLLLFASGGIVVIVRAKVRHPAYRRPPGMSQG
ncbi:MULTISPECIES: hypothetical protein [unclassified Rhodococcus (in: high G+C Gram-positive bacteria)]|uniref:hypothetical protein n=1 Tax=unclassified Rhodococcus (in: high G+C Gram-positive bacteria) TaxID=192944 RepID=UPI0015C96EAA|nr:MULTISPECIES: hypothetical protein [unclassified Rhodococcus (in: high G+C Gram-positive bacteria)]MBP1158901.1 hypothetical protein [Rhodococcus sp. PvR099]